MAASFTAILTGASTDSRCTAGIRIWTARATATRTSSGSWVCGWPTTRKKSVSRTLTYNPSGPISISGRIVDYRNVYDNLSTQATQAFAESSMITHAAAELGVPASELSTDRMVLQAIPSRQAIGWHGVVLHHGVETAVVTVDADATYPGSTLPLWGWRRLGAPALNNESKISVRSVDLGDDPSDPLGLAVTSALADGEPLVGSIYDPTMEVQLATERVVTLDMDGDPLILNPPTSFTGQRVTDATGSFLGSSGRPLQAQIVNQLMESFYAEVDGYLTDVNQWGFATKRWDSALPTLGIPSFVSDADPGTFAPRMLALVNADSSDEGPVPSSS